VLVEGNLIVWSVTFYGMKIIIIIIIDVKIKGDSFKYKGLKKLIITVTAVLEITVSHQTLSDQN